MRYAQLLEEVSYPRDIPDIVYIPVNEKQMKQIVTGLKLVWDPDETAQGLANDIIYVDQELKNRRRFTQGGEECQM